MGVPSRTSAPTPALDQTFDIQIILGKVRPFLRRLAEAHPQVLIIALSTTPPDTSALSAGGRAAGRAPRTTATATLPRERLVELYHGQGMSLQDIATDAGLSRQALTTMARDYGIDIREPHRPLSTSVDRVWLHEQYHTHRRTLPDIAREAGMSTTTLARWARKYGIPLRGRGGPSHAAAQAADSATITTRNAR